MAKGMSRGRLFLEAAARAISALEEMRDIQSEYEQWRDNLPENLQGSATYEKLDAVVELDIESALSTIQEAEGLELPMGFGRD